MEHEQGKTGIRDDQVDAVDAAVGRRRLRTGVVIVAIVISLLASAALVVAALTWSSAADSADQHTAAYEREAQQLQARQLTALSARDTLKNEALQIVNGFDTFDRAVDAVAASHKNALQVFADAIVPYNHGDFPAAVAKFAGDGAAAVADASAKTATADAALATVQKAIADLKVASRG